MTLYLAALTAALSITLGQASTATTDEPPAGTGNIPRVAKEEPIPKDAMKMMSAGEAGAEVTPAQKCKVKCTEEQGQCMLPCARAPGATDPKNQKKLLACTMGCMDAAKPCMSGCDRLEKKAKKK